MDLYIDPGTGSMLFAILVGIFGAVNYAVRTLFVKLNFFLSGGRKQAQGDQKYPLAVFSDDKRYWNVFEPLCKSFNKRGLDFVYLTASEDDPAFAAGLEHMKVEFLGEGNKAFARLNYLKAHVLLSTTPGLDVYQWKRSPEIDYYIHILHAAGEVLMYRMFGLDYYDMVLVGSNVFQPKDIRTLEALRGLPAKEIAVSGIPYMDEMYTRLQLEQTTKEKSSTPTVLLAPSWGSSAILARFGERIIQNLLDTGYNIIIRPHPQSFKSEASMIEALMKKYPSQERLEWNRDLDNFDCLMRADIMISDFSGVIFDFALVHNKPVIYTDTHIDVSPYDAWWVSEDLWTYSALKRIGRHLGECGNAQSLKALIDECLQSSSLKHGLDEVREEVWQKRGEGTLATVDIIINKLNELGVECKGSTDEDSIADPHGNAHNSLQEA